MCLWILDLVWMIGGEHEMKSNRHEWQISLQRIILRVSNDRIDNVGKAEPFISHLQLVQTQHMQTKVLTRATEINE